MAIEVKVLNNNKTIPVNEVSSNKTVSVDKDRDNEMRFSFLEGLIRKEILDRISGDTYLQEQIDAIVGKHTSIDVVEVYDRGSTTKSDIVHYDTSKLSEDNAIAVLYDETKENYLSFYTYKNNSWQRVASFLPPVKDVKVDGVSIVGSNHEATFSLQPYAQHILNNSNPHQVTKTQVGLGNVDNKSSETIRSEITSTNVTNALGYTPYDSTNPSGYVNKDVNNLTNYTKTDEFGSLAFKNNVNYETEVTNKPTIPTKTSDLTNDSNFVSDANYKHISVTSTSVSDGTTTFNKYNDTAISNRITNVENRETVTEGKVQTLETTVGNSSSGLVKGLSDEITRATGAEQGLDKRVQALEGRGRYLSGWNVSTGLPTDYPQIPEGATSPYTYNFKTGDYYIVSNVPSTGTKYFPTGSSITATKVGETWTWSVPKTTTTEDITVNDNIVYSSSSWNLYHTPVKEVAWGSIGGSIDDQTDLINKFNTKQDSITSTNKLSSDLVDDTNHNNKFVTQTDKTNWNAKSTVSVSATGTSTTNAKYITVDSVEYKLASEQDLSNYATKTYVNTAVQNEATARGDADTVLQTNITNEATTRGNADTNLQNQINAIPTTTVLYTTQTLTDPQQLQARTNIGLVEYTASEIDTLWNNI